VLVSIVGLAFGVNIGVLVGAVSLSVGGPSMIRVCAPAVSRSTADWTSRASLIIVSHSAGSRFEVKMVEALRWL